MNTKKPRFVLRGKNTNPAIKCFACGRRDGFIFLNIINDDLARGWDLSPSLRKYFDIRESTKCKNCGCSFRSNLQARTICSLLSPSSKSLSEAIRSSSQLRKLKIAEINACGALHKILAAHPKLQYSEYRPDGKNVKHENLNKLSYKSSSFDIVLTSETLEHVPDWRRAAREIHRVLKPRGQHIFTVPAILARHTRARALIQNGRVKKLLPAAYHGYNRGDTDDYLVFNEFGADFRKSMDEIGFDTKIYYRNIFHLSDPNFVFVSTKL